MRPFLLIGAIAALAGAVTIGALVRTSGRLKDEISAARDLTRQQAQEVSELKAALRQQEMQLSQLRRNLQAQDEVREETGSGPEVPPPNPGPGPGTVEDARPEALRTAIREELRIAAHEHEMQKKETQVQRKKRMIRMQAQPQADKMAQDLGLSENQKLQIARILEEYLLKQSEVSPFDIYDFMMNPDGGSMMERMQGMFDDPDRSRQQMQERSQQLRLLEENRDREILAVMTPQQQITYSQQKEAERQRQAHEQERARWEAERQRQGGQAPR